MPDKNKQGLTVETEDLAVPEVHTGSPAAGDAPEDGEPEEEIRYDDVAIPEIHLKKHRPPDQLPS